MDPSPDKKPHHLEITKSTLVPGVEKSDVEAVILQGIESCESSAYEFTGTGLTAYERELTEKLYSLLNSDPRTKCPQGKQKWGVFVGNNFCTMWLPPKNSIRIHAHTNRVSLYLFRF